MISKARLTTAALAVALGAAAGTAALAQPMRDDDCGPGRGPMGTDDEGWAGPGMMGFMGPETMGLGGHGMGPMMLVMRDADGDGAVSFEEIQAVHKRMFDLVDESGDGRITIQEMRAFRHGWWESE